MFTVVTCASNASKTRAFDCGLLFFDFILALCGYACFSDLRIVLNLRARIISSLKGMLQARRFSLFYGPKTTRVLLD